MFKSNTVNIESKSQLAKLFATENLTVEHNNVKTASFDLENRIVTLPIFKNPQGDVYDMLTAHECSHALFTPMKSWAKINDKKYLAYINVIEDTRIDRLIQKKYPGIVRNYINGFEILMKDNFFGVKDKDLNTDLMLIDKINMYYKSSKKLNINFSDEEKTWLDKIDNIKTFTDVLRIAKELYGRQEKQLKQLAMLPEFDKHSFAKNYKLDKNGDIIKTDLVEGEINVSSIDEKKDKNIGEAFSKVGNPDGAGGNVSVNTGLNCITDKNFEENKNKLLDTSKNYRYVTLPEPVLKNCLISYDQFLKDMRKNIHYHTGISNKDLLEPSSVLNQYRSEVKSQHIEYYNWIKQDFLQFKKNSLKTVMYLVKEFEMKKAASAYKRSIIDKTGVIDPLKLKNYKFSDDIFKRLTILPNSKNHGMIMLLDWSGSMCDIIGKTVHQLCNLVWFCQKVNIPFEVYLFKDVKEYGYTSDESITKKHFNFKKGDAFADDILLVNVASHKMKKTVLHESLFYLYNMCYYIGRSYFGQNHNRHEGNPIPMDQSYNLTSTPLNEALIICQKLIPIFKSKYKVEKLSFITLTDGDANSDMADYSIDTVDTVGTVGSVNNVSPNLTKKFSNRDIFTQTIIKDNNKQYTLDRFKIAKENNSRKSLSSSQVITSTLLSMIQKKYNVVTIGFFLSKRNTKNTFTDFVPWMIRDNLGNLIDNPNFEKLRKQFIKDKVIEIKKPGYDSYYVINIKNTNIENFDISDIKQDESTANIKKIFTKSMKNRIHSRVLLNKFIEQIS